MARGRRAGHGDLLSGPSRRVRPGAALAWLAVAAIAAGCGIFPQYGVEVTQQVTTVSFHVDGQTDAEAGWLCPSDPGPGETLGAAGAARLDAHGCINLGEGVTDDEGWTVTFDIRRLPADKLGAFRPGQTYRLLVNHGDADSGGTYSTDVPPLTLIP